MKGVWSAGQALLGSCREKSLCECNYVCTLVPVHSLVVVFFLPPVNKYSVVQENFPPLSKLVVRPASCHAKSETKSQHLTVGVPQANNLCIIPAAREGWSHPRGEGCVPLRLLTPVGDYNDCR